MSKNQTIISGPKKVTSTQYVGTVKIGEREIPCAVLFPDTDNPVRVFIQYSTN